MAPAPGIRLTTRLDDALRSALAPLAAAAALVAAPAQAWDAPVHRAITEVALAKAAEASGAAWLAEPATVARAAFTATEADRYRGTKIAFLDHENGPEHYLDIELLGAHDLSLATLPPLRYDFVNAVARTSPPPQPSGERRGVTTPPNAPKGVTDIGFVPYAIAEHYAKLVSAMNTVRVLERINEAERAEQVAAARASVVTALGHLSHFVADAAQPLHTTIHHHGWVGDNPEGFTDDRGFHAYIDGAIVLHHALDRAAIAEATPAPRAIDAAEIWPAILAHLERSHALMRPLYVMHRDGSLREEPGKALIRERLGDAASTLAGFYLLAWQESAPRDEADAERQVADFRKYEGIPSRNEPIPRREPVPAKRPGDAP
jgi:hypothetical protein